MSFLTKLKANPVATFVLEAAHVGLKRAIGSKARPAKGANIQCVKLNHEHAPLVQIATQWCNERATKLKELGVDSEKLAAMNRRDATFLTSLASAIANSKDAKVDTWLFYSDSVQSTHYFELQQCERGTKTMRCSQAIHASI
jgi:hypothetical protein